MNIHPLVVIIFCWIYPSEFVDSSSETIGKCLHENQSYPIGSVVWQSPECDCIQMICRNDGQVHMEKMQKPCCTYKGKSYGNKEVISTDECFQLYCYEGKVTSIPHCPDGFRILTYNGIASCYHISHETFNWYDSRYHCSSMGSSLAVVSSIEENNALQDYLSHLQSKSGWLGAGVEPGSNVLTWQFGSISGAPVSATYNKLEPNSFRTNVSDVF